MWVLKCVELRYGTRPVKSFHRRDECPYERQSLNSPERRGPNTSDPLDNTLENSVIQRMLTTNTEETNAFTEYLNFAEIEKAPGLAEGRTILRDHIRQTAPRRMAAWRTARRKEERSPPINNLALFRQGKLML